MCARVCVLHTLRLASISRTAHSVNFLFRLLFWLFFIATENALSVENEWIGKALTQWGKHTLKSVSRERERESATELSISWLYPVECALRCALALSFCLSLSFSLLPALFECIVATSCLVVLLQLQITWPPFVRLSRCLRLLSLSRCFWLWFCLFLCLCLSRLKRFRKS